MSILHIVSSRHLTNLFQNTTEKCVIQNMVFNGWFNYNDLLIELKLVSPLSVGFCLII